MRGPRTVYPLKSSQARRRRRLSGLIKQSWLESGCVYGHRKIHHDLLRLGESCAPNTVAKLMQSEGLRAQIGYKRRPGKYGTRPAAVAANQLQQDFNVTTPDTVWVTTSPISARMDADIARFERFADGSSGDANQQTKSSFTPTKLHSLPAMIGVSS